MGLYRIMVVDDEEEIRLGIINKINWQENGFVVVGHCENGIDALEKTIKLRPDIIMTDVKMPFMDGLELGKRISELMPSIKIIIFSGCDDFEYAQKALKINAVGYVLKPINSLELIELLKKIRELLDEEYRQKRDLQVLRNHYNESIPIIREQLLVGVIEGRISDIQWEEQREKLKIDLGAEFYSVALVKVEKNNSLNEFGSELEQQELELSLIALKNIIDENMSNYCKFVSFSYSDMVVIIGNFNNKEDVNLFIQGLDEIRKVFSRIMQMKTSIGIGHVYSNVKEIRFSYRTAQNALDYRFVLGIGKTIFIEDVEPDNTIYLNFDEHEERAFANAIKLSGEEEIIKVIDGLFTKVEELVVPLNQYRVYFMEIMTAMLKIIQTYKLDIVEIFGENFNCYSYLENFNSYTDLKIWFIDIAIRVNVSIKKERVNSSKVLVEKAKQFIKGNYKNPDMSVETICSKLHVSTTYFSTIFKRETEMSFVNYLTSVRLEEAIKLLKTTDDKTYIIAKKVGYLEPNYFSYVFKKKFGVSPMKYRKN